MPNSERFDLHGASEVGEGLVDGTYVVQTKKSQDMPGGNLPRSVREQHWLVLMLPQRQFLTFQSYYPRIGGRARN